MAKLQQYLFDQIRCAANFVLRCCTNFAILKTRTPTAYCLLPTACCYYYCYYC
jgi:hypothetical protein